ncbi:hypothetical protein IAE37_005308 [Pseudomonas sp. S31]|uniref:hypothetical protein n=1 Tax=Pseudomonas sp. S31 TaxID=1564473 RepID=UPI001913E731|nr:hypothetical protein [Pseudomonas sp. S31]MBK5003032.1 hypothetical protein [Pseudomonas sp. S31]
MSEFEKLFGAQHLPKPATGLRGDSPPKAGDTESMTIDFKALERALAGIESRLDEKVSRIETNATSSHTAYLRELELRDEALHREMNLKERAFRREQKAHAKSLDERLNRMAEASASTAKEIKDFKLWMAGIGIAVVLGIMGANATIFSGGKSFFDGGKEHAANQQRIDSLIQESKAQTEASKAILDQLQRETSRTSPSTPK